MLLALLSLGVKNIHFGPTLLGFLSPNVANVLVQNFGIGIISTIDEDLKAKTNLFRENSATQAKSRIAAFFVLLHQ